ncbi:MAG: DsbA family protein [Sphingomonas sp.]
MNDLARIWIALAAFVAGAGSLWGGQQLAHATSGMPGSAASARDYVLAHPEMISEVIDTLRQRQSGAVIAANRSAILDPYAGAWAGNPKGDVTIVEYFDYNCGYCRASLPTIQKLLADDPKLRIVFRELPILSPQSGDAAKLSLAAAAQGKFRAFHLAMYAGGPITPDSMNKAVQVAGVDPSRTAPGAEQEIERNLTIARDLGLSGTPSWVIGNRAVSGALPLDTFKKAIAEARAAH